jgi:uncharacterized protein YdgA (DUF945 family)
LLGLARNPITTIRTLFMRKILLFSAAFILAIATMPFVFGLLTEHRVNNAIQQANLPEGVLIEVKSYDRGYLQSHALMNITLVDIQAPETSEQPPKILTFNLEADMRHGPFFKAGALGYRVGMAHVHAYIKPEDLGMANEQLAKTISAVFADKEIVGVDAVLNMFGDFDSQFHSSAANFHDDGNSVTWGGIQGKLYLSGDNNKIKTTLNISPMLLQSKDKSSLDFSEISIISEAKRKTDMPWVGEQSLNIPSFFMRNEQGDEVRFSHLIVTAGSKVEGKLTSAHMDAKADNLQLLSQLIQDTQLRIAVDKLDAKSFIEFSKITQNNINDLTDDQRRDLTLSMINMLSPGTLIEFQHDMNIAEGPVNTKLTIQFPDLTQADDKLPPEVLTQRLFTEINAALSMQAPNKWLENSLVNIAASSLPADAPAHIDPVTKVKMTAQEALHHDISNQLKALSQAGILVNDGTHYAFQLNYQNGVITLNGNKLTQDDIMRLMSMFSHQPAQQHAPTPAPVVP